jgi:hypothetical protein
VVQQGGGACRAGAVEALRWRRVVVRGGAQVREHGEQRREEPARGVAVGAMSTGGGGSAAVARGCTVERRSGGAGNYGGTWELEQMVAMAARA